MSSLSGIRSPIEYFGAKLDQLKVSSGIKDQALAEYTQFAGREQTLSTGRIHQWTQANCGHEAAKVMLAAQGMVLHAMINEAVQGNGRIMGRTAGLLKGAFEVKGGPEFANEVSQMQCDPSEQNWKRALQICRSVCPRSSRSSQAQAQPNPISPDFDGGSGRMKDIPLNTMDRGRKQGIISFVRDQKNAQVQGMLASWNGKMDGVKMHYYRHEGPWQKRQDSIGSTCVLGRFDAFSIEGCAFDYGADYKPLKGQQPRLNFTYIAALNIGESNAPVSDYNDYLVKNVLDVDSVVQDTKEIFLAGLRGQKQTGSKHFIWNPVGMGAFLRKISQNDPQTANQIRKGFTEALLQVFDTREFKGHHLHICLPNVTGESSANLKAFAVAAEKFPQLKGRLKLYENMDMLDLGATLHADGGANLIVAANRHLLGNHWFANGALVASDENFTRRNPGLAFYTTIANNGSYKRSRSQTDLSDRFKYFDPKSYLAENPGKSLEGLLQECFAYGHDFRPVYALMKEKDASLPSFHQVPVPHDVIAGEGSYKKYIKNLIAANRHLLQPIAANGGPNHQNAFQEVLDDKLDVYGLQIPSRDALDGLKEHQKNEIFGAVYALAVAKGLPTNHHDFGRAAFFGFDGQSIPGSLRREAVVQIMRQYHG